MDPLSVLRIVTGLIATCTGVASGFQSMIGKYPPANVQISAICAECSVIRISLSQVERLLSNLPETTPPQSLEEGLGQCLDASLAGCSLVLSALEEELRRFGVDMDSDGGRNRSARTAYAWDPLCMKELLDALRGQQSAVTLFFVLLQSKSVGEMHAILRARNGSLYTTVTQTRSLRERYPDAAARAASIVEPVTASGSVFGDLSSESSTFEEDLLDFGLQNRLGIRDSSFPPAQNPVQSEFPMINRRVQQMQTNQARQNLSDALEAQRTAQMASNQLRNYIVKGDIPNAATLLKQGVDISEKFEYSGQTITLLHNAVSQGNVEMVKLLLIHQHPIDIATLETGTTPLHVAVVKDYPNIVRLLLECGADVECQMIKQLAAGEQPLSSNCTDQFAEGRVHPTKLINNWTGLRPLHCAAVYNRPECARLLLEFGASVDSKTAQNLNTPLHLSAVFGNSDVSEVLLKYGADRMARDNSGFPVFSLGPSHKPMLPPKAWGPSQLNINQTSDPRYVCSKS